jgi:hypothetical protein
MRRASAALAVLVFALAVPAVAQEGGSVTVTAGSNSGPAPAGEHLLASEQTGLEGRTCDVSVTVTNNESPWPGNSLRVETGGDALVVDDPEAVPNASVSADKSMVLGADLDVILVVAEGSSLEAIVAWECAAQSSTTIAETTTTTVAATSTSAPSTTVAVEAGEATTTAPPVEATSPPETLPFTGPVEDAGLVLAALGAAALGLVLVRAARKDDGPAD